MSIDKGPRSKCGHVYDRRSMADIRSRILIVDDDAQIVSGLEALLSDEWEVRTATTGKEALVTFADFSPDIVPARRPAPRLLRNGSSPPVQDVLGDGGGDHDVGRRQSRARHRVDEARRRDVSAEAVRLRHADADAAAGLADRRHAARAHGVAADRRERRSTACPASLPPSPSSTTSSARSRERHRRF